MRRSTFSFLLFIGLFTSSAQEALDQLLVQYAGDRDMVRRLKQFKAEGAEQDFDVSSFQPEDFIASTRAYLGVPYKYGGMSRKGIDCSGLIAKALQDLGLEAPHNANEIAKYGKIILDKDELKPGDLIFFSRTYNTPRLVSHAGFVVEGDQMLHASNSGVNITSIHNPYYYDKHYLFGTRLFEEAEQVVEPKPVVVATPEPVKPKPDIMAVGYQAVLKTGVYDPKYRGKYTSSGEKYRKNALTASHRSYPVGTLLQLTNLRNGKMIVVRVNDGNRKRSSKSLYVSAKAARKLKMKKGGTTRIRIEVLSIGRG